MNASPPDLAQYMNKRLYLHLNSSRKISGILRGYDVFLNVVLEEAEDEHADGPVKIGTAVIRGESIMSLETV